MQFVLAIVAWLCAATALAVAADRDAAVLTLSPTSAGVSQLATRASTINDDRIELLLDTIVVWVSGNFDLPAVFDHPEVHLVSDETLTSMRYGENSDGGRRVVALYDEGRVYLSESWSSRSPAELSVLVHEMVHHLQEFGDHIYSCAGEREELAYEAQEKWLNLFGGSLQHDFEIDPLTLKVAVVCIY